ncbi:lymphocyte-specific helicase-like [Lycorma delicatula]|uniref:lymphocyte-specific helicase-like n=1 Tax=Lycorma delicatula TaxID=130591 RepID=UPI003F519DB7
MFSVDSRMEESNDRMLLPCSTSNESSVLTYLTAGNDDDDASTSSTECSMESGDVIITDKMIEEEKMLAAEAAREEEKLKKEMEEHMKKEEKEQRYKRLMHLLSKSQFYSSYLFKKLEQGSNDEKGKSVKKTRKPKQQLDSKENSKTLTEKNSNLTTDSNEGVDNCTKSVNVTPKAPTSHTSSRKRKVTSVYYNDTYNIKDITSKEEFENVKKARMESNRDKDIKNVDLNDIGDKNVCNNENGPDNEEDKTKITGLGFKVPVNQPDLLEGGVLRDYQLQGIEWLKLIFENGLNGILADEMGLGKTIQVIGLICFLIEKGIKGPYLIVAPLSTLSNWILEFEKFAPQVPVVLFHGTQQQRKTLHRALCKFHKVGEFVTRPVVVTSYEVPLRETPILTSIAWDYVIVDEGHRIKNANSYLSRVLRSIKSNNRLLLTGTPLQNNLTELWSLLNFLLPELFDDLSTFEAWFDVQEMEKAEGAEKIIQQEREQKVISTLHQILFPFLLRRIKTDVILDFPPKKEVMVFCPMTSVQMEMYKVIVDKSIASLVNVPEPFDKKRSSRSIYRKGSQDDDKLMNTSFQSKTNEYFPLDKMPACRELTEKLGATVAGNPGFVNRLHMQRPTMVLKHIVNHPYLVRMPVRYKNGTKVLHVTKDLKNVSGKLLVLDAMLAKLKQKGHKVLIFCTSAMMLDLLEEYVIMAKYSYVRLDGSTSLLDRKNYIYAFNTNPKVFVFLLTTRAGGLGINLTGADTVILYNSDWNPQADLQAQDRAHRIGQTKPVVVYRFNVAGTVDEKIITRASSKRKLEKIVMKQGAFNLGSRRKNDLFDLQELKELLQTTDAQKQMHSNGFIFSDEELEELLDRSDLIDGKHKNDATSESDTKGKMKDGECKNEDGGDNSKDDGFVEESTDNKSPKKKLYEVLKVEK